MPSFELVVKSKINKSFRTSKIIGMFDIPHAKEISKQWNVDIPIENLKWNIGVIVGASGSGKTTIGKNLFKGKYHTNFKWSDDKSIVDDFADSLDVKVIVESLSKVGFSSPPAWLLPYNKLSNGQKFRTEIARCVLENDLTVFDEFTSVVDRQVAKIGCAAVSKFIKKMNKQFVALSCHYDILEWLQPDWIYDVSTGEFNRGNLRRPKIKAEIYECDKKAWELFKGHHYLTADINKSCKVYVMFINDVPVGFCAVLPFPHGHIKNGYREHRTVVLPDYQGIGLGNLLSTCVASIMKHKGKRFFSTTSHPAMINFRIKSDDWAMIRKPSFVGKFGKTSRVRYKASSDRLTTGFEYIGE